MQKHQLTKSINVSAYKIITHM